MLLHAFEESSKTFLLGRPHAQQSLIQIVFLVAIGRRPRTCLLLVPRVEITPALEAITPFLWNLRENVEAGADIFASLCVVSRGCVQGARPTLLPLVQELEEYFGRSGVGWLRISADLVQ